MKNGVKTRGNGQGSAIKLKTNNWKAIAVIGYKDGDPSKPIRRTKSGFKTKSEALAYIPTLKHKCERIEKLTLKTAYDRWLPQHVASKGTINCYKAAFQVFYDCWYLDLNDQDIDELQSCIDESEKGKRTLQNAKVVLGLVYKWAIPRGYVKDNVNLSEFLKVRSGETKHKEGFTLQQLEIIKNAVGAVPYADYIYCNCYLGFRPSAFLALHYNDYNAEEQAFRGGIKTEAGKNRTVTVSPKIQPIIDRLIQASNAGYIFGRLGEPMSPAVYRKLFYECLDALNIQKLSDPHKLTPHSCRHTFATLMKNINAPDKDKLELIGHTSDEMLRYYQDVRYEDLRKITDQI